MLVLSRKESQRIRLGDSIVITIVKISGDKVRIGIDAPSNVLVLRDELESARAGRRGRQGVGARGRGGHLATFGVELALSHAACGSTALHPPAAPREASTPITEQSKNNAVAAKCKAATALVLLARPKPA